MTEHARDITYRTFMRHVGLDAVLDLFPTYEKYPARGLTIKNDWAVSYHKSRYNGKPCYYLCHSRIEYIFVATDAIDDTLDTESY